jgi:hypothetical protein
MKRKRMRARLKQVVVHTTAPESDWMTVREACLEAKRSRPTLYDWIHLGLIESFVSKTRPDSTTGIRLVRRRSLRAFLEKQFKESQVNQPVVRMPMRKEKEVAAA